MDAHPSPSSADDQEADQALRDARSRFVAGFTQRHGAMGTLLASFTAAPDPAPLGSLRGAAHNMAGLAGMLGFPTVSEHASTLEVALLQEPVNGDAAGAALARMGAGFAHDLSGAAPTWAQAAGRSTTGARILIVEDDHEQRRVAAAGLRSAGYRVVTAESGTEAIATARSERPDFILLDVDLPGMDGMAVCRQLKLDPVLSAIPVMFCSARTGVIDRMAGLTLGADDYITKPYSPGEMLVRIRHLLSRDGSAAAAPPAPSGVLPYDIFAPAAAELVSRGQAAIVLLRVDPSDMARVTSRLMDDLRRRDLLGQFSDSHLILVTPDMSAVAARTSVRAMVDAVVPPVNIVSIGAADAAQTSRTTLEALIAQADLALAQDRVAKNADGGKTTVLLAEDDPDVLHIIDTRLRAGGYRTVLALDGQQTLDALDRESPAVMLLDLMMPKVTGFEILTKLRGRAHRPRVIVVSARGRDEDVTRAFELGADDYVNKPFNPEELVARIARLTR